MLRINRQKGVVTLMLTIVILMIITLTTLYTSRVVVADDKIFANTYRNNQALDAARAGYDYALAYLIANTSTVTTGLSSCAVGNETYALTSGTLANNATYTMTYGCVTAASTTYLTITAVGTSADTSAVKTVTGMVKSLGSTNPTPFVSRSSITLTAASSANSVITNSLSGALYAVTVHTGQTVTQSPSGTTSITPNATLQSATLTGLSDSAFVTNYIGTGGFSVFSSDPGASGGYAKITCTGSATFTGVTTFASPPAGCTVNSNTTGKSAPFAGNPSNPITSGVMYIAMTGASGSNTLTVTNSATGRAYVFGTTASPSILVVYFSNNNGSVVFTGASNNNPNALNGGVYTNGSLSLLGVGGNANTTITLNGLGFVGADGASTTPSVTLSTSSRAVAINGEMVARALTYSQSSTGTINTTLNSTNLGYIQGLPVAAGSAAINGIEGGGITGYGFVAGSLKDF